MVQEVATTVKLEYKYKARVGNFSQHSYSIIAVSVDNGDDGFNCWGFEHHPEMSTEGSGVVYNPNWKTAGDAFNAALENYHKKYSPLKVTNG